MDFDILGDFYRRFKVPVNEKDEFLKFRNRVHNAIKNVALLPLSDYQRAEQLFGYFVGTSQQSALNLLDWHIGDAENLTDLLHNIELLFLAFKAADVPQVIPELYEAVSFALGISPLIAIRIAKTEDGIVFYPKGAEILDPALIDDVLNWLADYPRTNKAYVDALTQYGSGDPSVYRNLLDNLRVSVEELLRAILGNEKSLENQDKVLPGWLNDHGVDQNINTSFVGFLFGPYRILQNDEVKHGSAQFSEPEIEIILYLTGTILRFLVRVKQQEH
jgi:hypothetical protein